MNDPLYTVESGVLIGNDGWLFLFEGSNMVSSLFADPNQFLGENLLKWRELLLERKSRINLLGAKYLHLWVPDKLSVYPEHVPKTFVLHSKTPTQALTQADPLGTDGTSIDILPHLLKAKAEHLLYWKTDTHWTYEGACVAYEVICSHFDVPVVRDLWSRPSSKIERALDLGGKLKPAVKETCHFVSVLKDSRISYKNELVRFLELLDSRYHGAMHVGSSVRFENLSSSAIQKTLLIFGDSYCEYRPHLLSAILAETFRTVQFVWSARIDYRLVERLGPDIVLSETAERFMGQLPTDDLDLSSAPFKSISAFLNSKCLTDGETSLRWSFS